MDFHWPGLSMLLSSAPPNRSSSLPWRLFFCIPYLPNTKPSVFYSVLQAPFMPPLCPTPEAWWKTRSEAMSWFSALRFLTPSFWSWSNLIPKNSIRSPSWNGWAYLRWSSAYLSGCQIWSDHLYFPPRLPFTSGSKFVIYFSLPPWSAIFWVFTP